MRISERRIIFVIWLSRIHAAGSLRRDAGFVCPSFTAVLVRQRTHLGSTATRHPANTLEGLLAHVGKDSDADRRHIDEHRRHAM